MSTKSLRGKQAQNRRSGRFAPGCSGNPCGRPRSGSTAADCLRKALTREAWARQVAKLAKQGSIQALTLYASYCFGRPPSEAESEIERRLAELEARAGIGGVS